MNDIEKIERLINERADYNARLLRLPYAGTPEVRVRNGEKYLYTKRRVGGKTVSKYIGPYSSELYSILLTNNDDAKFLRKKVRTINKELSFIGFEDKKLSEKVLRNIDFARANMNLSIHEQAILEGVSTSYPQTENIIENGIVSGMTAVDVQKIINLKHAWEFILNPDMLGFSSNLNIACHISGIINANIINNSGSVRNVPVRIGGTDYLPSIPEVPQIEQSINNILAKKTTAIETAIDLALFVMRTQVFLDGNKRTGILLANHYLVGHGAGLMVVPEKHVAEFKKLLIGFYETNDSRIICKFLKEYCWQKLT